MIHNQQTGQVLADRDALRRMVDVALPIAKARAVLVGEIRAALEQGDERHALVLARRLCGLPASDSQSAGREEGTTRLPRGRGEAEMERGYERVQQWAREAGTGMRPEHVDLTWRLVALGEGADGWPGGLKPLQELPPEEADRVADEVILGLIEMILGSRARVGQQSERFIEHAARFVTGHPERLMVVQAPGIMRTPTNRRRAKAILQRAQDLQASGEKR